MCSDAIESGQINPFSYVRTRFCSFSVFPYNVLRST